MLNTRWNLNNIYSIHLKTNTNKLANIEKKYI